MRVAILTPAEGVYRQAAVDFSATLMTVLEGAGFTATAVPWTDPEAAAAAGDLVLPLVAWGYHLDLPRWFAAVGTLEASGKRVLNPPSVLRWNSDKAYLQRLEAQGAPIVATAFVDHADEPAVEGARTRFGGGTVVVKPRVSGGAFGTIRVEPGGSLEGGPEGPAMIQPYLDAVEGEGEYSLLYFNRRFSHALTKTAVGGDFRVQPQFGGVVQAVTPPPEAFATAERVLAAVEEPLLYARVDILRDADGQWRLMELEAVEPHLFLDQAADGGRAFTEAVAATFRNS
jgi:glutathione synthase/RimK-type ligase-like ATP-grasp enzyme